MASFNTGMGSVHVLGSSAVARSHDAVAEGRTRPDSEQIPQRYEPGARRSRSQESCDMTAKKPL